LLAPAAHEASARGRPRTAARGCGNPLEHFVYFDESQRGAGSAGERSGITHCRRADADSSLPRLARQERDGDLDLRGRETLKQGCELADLDEAAARLRNRRTRHDEVMKEHPRMVPLWIV
jgi:hypothetical protein